MFEFKFENNKLFGLKNNQYYSYYILAVHRAIFNHKRLHVSDIQKLDKDMGKIIRKNNINKTLKRKNSDVYCSDEIVQQNFINALIAYIVERKLTNDGI